MPDQTAARTASMAAVTALSKRSQHSQMCPVWTGRATGTPVAGCTCWVRPNAARTVDAVLAALADGFRAAAQAITDGPGTEVDLLSDHLWQMCQQDNLEVRDDPRTIAQHAYRFFADRLDAKEGP